jgi:hypothetical protein
VLKGLFGPKRNEVEENRKYCIIKNVIICLYQILLKRRNEVWYSEGHAGHVGR